MRARSMTEEIRALAGERDPACLLDASGTILFVNDAWDRYAAAHGGGGRSDGVALVGTRWLDHVAGEVPRSVHQGALARALAAEAPPVALTSEANDPERARLVTTVLRPIRSGPGRPAAGVAVVHRVVRERPIAEVYEPVAAEGEALRGDDGTIAQCACCRRTRRPSDPDQWDFVVGQVAGSPPDVAWCYCPLCLELHVGAEWP
ncbi:MAG TPA: hypothetical protein VLU43_09435 [Anaeromyxobacteraceae bacterium]|nr:hypothetical protein [Anaeromyxobacteraceae bacterium]